MNEILSNKINSETVYLPFTEIAPFIHPTAVIRNSSIVGNVIINENVHIVNAAVRADEGSPFYIGANSNIQDFAVLHSYTTQKNQDLIKENLVFIPEQGYYAIYICQNVTVAHGALIHGPSKIGCNTFIGFKATVDKASIGSNVEIGAHAYIKKVSIPDNIGIAPNAVILKEEDIKKYTVPLIGVNEKIIQVNLELAKAYK
ncbi:MAG: carbonate dehydratase [bacterium]